MTSLVKAIQERLAKVCDDEASIQCLSNGEINQLATNWSRRTAEVLAAAIRAADLSDLEPKEGATPRTDEERIAALLIDLELLNFMDVGVPRHWRRGNYQRIREFLISLAPSVTLPEHEKRSEDIWNVQVGSDRNAVEEACRGCGKGLLLENAWMEDGCPCNTPAGINNRNLYRWKLLHDLQQRDSSALHAKEAECETAQAEIEDARSLAFNLLPNRTERDASGDLCEQIDLLGKRYADPRPSP